MASYKVIFLGLSIIGPEEETRLISGLQKRFKLSPERADSLLQRVPIVVKKGLTKEEAQRYAKAFEDIGGRIKLEEEEEPVPTLDITRDFEPPQKPESRTEPSPEPIPGRKPSLFDQPAPEKPLTKGMISCPQCGFEQPETDECIKCGVIMSKYVQYQERTRSVEGYVREISSDEYTPWESGEGFVGAFFKTTQEVLFSPIKFFKKVAAGDGYWSPFIFAMITGIIGSGVALLWQWLFLSGIIPHQIFSVETYGFFLTIVVVSIPVWIALLILLGSGVTHLCLMIVGGNRKGFAPTFRAVSYSFSAALFYIVPFIGNLVGLIYLFVLAILGVREGHEISTGKALLGVLLPFIILVGVFILLAILVPLFFGRLLVPRGVGA